MIPNDRTSPPGGSSAGVVALSLLSGAALPASYYIRRTFFPSELIWVAPEHTFNVIALVVIGSATGALWYRMARGADREGDPKSALSSPRAHAHPHPGRAAPWQPLILVAAALLWWRWKFRFLIGDAEEWLEYAGSPFIMSSEPLGHWMHYFFHRGAGLVGIDSTETALRLSSIAAGLVYLGATLRIAPRAFGRLLPWIAPVFLFVSPVGLFFTGFIETTPWAYALTGVYLLSGLRYLALGLRRPPWIESAILMFAVWTHGMVLFATGAHAALLVLWFIQINEDSFAGQRPRRFLTLALLAVAPFFLFGVTLLVAYLFGSGDESVPWYGTALGGRDEIRWVAFGERKSEWHYVFGEFIYVRDLANLIVLVAPMFFILPVAIWRLRDSASRALVFLGSALGGLLILTMFWNADYGMRWDFDLLSLFALPTQLIVLLWWNERLERRGQIAVALWIGAAAFFCSMIPYLRFP